jgi:FkbM family methyltransferase
MFSSGIKDLVLWAIAKGLRLPQAPLDRVSELILLKNLLEQLQIDCVLDVGANRGQFAQEVRKIGYRGLIVSFEPVGSEFLVMKEKFASDAHWRRHQVALGSENASMSITVPHLTVMSSLLTPLNPGKADRTEVVDVKRLDDMMRSLQKLDSFSRAFLKMDTQGYDLEVFSGASGCIDMIQGIQSELSIQPLYADMPHYIEALNTYEGAGFDLHNLSVVNRLDNEALLEMNCFMRRR